MRPFFVFDTHPIQYRGPVFAELVKRCSNLSVFYFNRQFDGSRFWFHEVGKIPDQPFGLPEENRFPNRSLESQQKGLWSFFGEVRSLLRENRPRGILIYGYFLPEHWILWLLCWWYRVPIVFIGETFTRSGASWWRSGIKRVVQPLFFAGIERVVSIGERTAEFYRSLGMRGSRVFSANYCVDTAFFDRPMEDSKAIRTRVRTTLGISESAFVVLFVGRLFERKRPADVLELHRLCSQEGEFHSILAGNGPMEKQFQRERLPNFHSLGFQNQAQVRDLYHAADLLFVPSEYETWGLVVNEAFACRLPALVTETCGCAHDLVIDGKTGWVFPVGNLELASKKVQKMMHSSELSHALKYQAYERVTQKYRVGQMADAIFRAFQSVG